MTDFMSMDQAFDLKTSKLKTFAYSSEIANRNALPYWFVTIYISLQRDNEILCMIDDGIYDWPDLHHVITFSVN